MADSSPPRSSKPLKRGSKNIESSRENKRRRSSDDAPSPVASNIVSPERLDNRSNLSPSGLQNPGPSFQYSQGETDRLPHQVLLEPPSPSRPQRIESKNMESSIKNKRHHPYGSRTDSRRRLSSENAPSPVASNIASPERLHNQRNKSPSGPRNPGPSGQTDRDSHQGVAGPQYFQSSQAISSSERTTEQSNPRPDVGNLQPQSRVQQDLSPTQQNPYLSSQRYTPSPYKNIIIEKRVPHTSTLGVGSTPSYSFERSSRSISAPKVIDTSFDESEIPTMEDLERIERSSRELIEFGKKLQKEKLQKEKLQKEQLQKEQSEDSVRTSEQPATHSPSDNLNLEKHEENISRVSLAEEGDSKTVHSIEQSNVQGKNDSSSSEDPELNLEPPATRSPSDYFNSEEPEGNISRGSLVEKRDSETEQCVEQINVQGKEFSSSSEHPEMDSEPFATRSPSYYLNLEDHQDNISRGSLVEKPDSETKQCVEKINVQGKDFFRYSEDPEIDSKSFATRSPSDFLNMEEYEYNISRGSSVEKADSETEQCVEQRNVQGKEFSSSSEDPEMDSEPFATSSLSDYLNLEGLQDNISHGSLVEEPNFETEPRVEQRNVQEKDDSSSSENSEIDLEPPATRSTSYFLCMEEREYNNSRGSSVEERDSIIEYCVDPRKVQGLDVSSSSEDPEMDSEQFSTRSPSDNLNLEENVSLPSIIEKVDPVREPSAEPDQREPGSLSTKDTVTMSEPSETRSPSDDSHLKERKENDPVSKRSAEVDQREGGYLPPDDSEKIMEITEASTSDRELLIRSKKSSESQKSRACIEESTQKIMDNREIATGGNLTSRDLSFTEITVGDNRGWKEDFVSDELEVTADNPESSIQGIRSSTPILEHGHGTLEVQDQIKPNKERPEGDSKTSSFGDHSYISIASGSPERSNESDKSGSSKQEVAVQGSFGASQDEHASQESEGFRMLLSVADAFDRMERTGDVVLRERNGHIPDQDISSSSSESV